MNDVRDNFSSRLAAAVSVQANIYKVKAEHLDMEAAIKLFTSESWEYTLTIKAPVT